MNVCRSSWSAPLGALFSLFFLSWTLSPLRSTHSQAAAPFSPVFSARTSGAGLEKRTWALRRGAADDEEGRISFWHDVPLFLHSSPSHSREVRFVCEVPRGATEKQEMQRDEPLNPIAPDSEYSLEGSLQGKRIVRHYRWQSLANYGLLPQTFSDPALLDPLTRHFGDGDPLDALDICVGRPPCSVGDVYPVRILGAIALSDANASDWKVIVIRLGCFYRGAGLRQSKRHGGGDLISDLSEATQTLQLSLDAGQQGALEENVARISLDRDGRKNLLDLASDDRPFNLIAGPQVDPSLERAVLSTASIDDNSFTVRVRQYAAGLVEALAVWFCNYKRPLVQGEKSFLLGGEPLILDFGAQPVDGNSASSIVWRGHRQWCSMLEGGRGHSAAVAALRSCSS
jgi:inorganic pyrophosphatase